jgi:hypothetical protein
VRAAIDHLLLQAYLGAKDLLMSQNSLADSQLGKFAKLAPKAPSLLNLFPLQPVRTQLTLS